MYKELEDLYAKACEVEPWSSNGGPTYIRVHASDYARYLATAYRPNRPMAVLYRTADGPRPVKTEAEIDALIESALAAADGQTDASWNGCPLIVDSAQTPGKPVFDE